MRSPRSSGRCARGKSTSAASDRMVIPGTMSEFSMFSRTRSHRASTTVDCLLCLRVAWRGQVPDKPLSLGGHPRRTTRPMPADRHLLLAVHTCICLCPRIWPPTEGLRTSLGDMHRGPKRKLLPRSETRRAEHEKGEADTPWCQIHRRVECPPPFPLAAKHQHVVESCPQSLEHIIIRQFQNAGHCSESLGLSLAGGFAGDGKCFFDVVVGYISHEWESGKAHSN